MYSEFIERLPYGFQYLFIDSIVDTDAERYIECSKHYSALLEIVKAHKKIGGYVPGNVLCEQAAQSALLLGLIRGIVDLDSNTVVLAKQKSDFLIPAKAPCEIISKVNILAIGDTKIGYEAKLETDGVCIAKIKGVCAILEEHDK